MRKVKRLLLPTAICLAVLFLGMVPGKTVWAAGARVSFGSEAYNWKLGERFPIGIYLTSEDGSSLDSVNIRVQYDPAVLKFDSSDHVGISVISEGEFMIKRDEGWDSEFKQMLYFIPLVSEPTEIRITSGLADTAERLISAEEEASASIEIPMAEGCALNALSVGGVPVEGFSPEKQSYELTVPGEIVKAEIEAEAADGAAVTVFGESLKAGENLTYVTVENTDGEKARYTLHITREAPPEGAVDSGETEQGNGEPGGTAGEEGSASEGNLPGEAGDSTTASESQENGSGWPGNETEVQNGSTQKWPFVGELPKVVKLLAAVLAVMVLVEIVTLTFHFTKKKRARRKRMRQRALAIKKRERLELEAAENPVVIKAEHVSMDFSREVKEYSSIKELLIRTVKGQRNKEKYRALNDVSFEIRKGEVVGVIGTNGAGKSTLLKIVSGALRPTAGKMLVNKKRVQILTLGTGFDMELTGRENVYLNGAIIGYEKAFIDEHYEQIVEFAELEGFMGEKVKNYSSGMVSRLGFAIATVGNAAEILILDEVLSVGDRLFQKKSLARVKEMIHGGSTVIMVSHSTKTIRENCSKAIWIEKGRLVAQGEVKEVCDMYEKYDGDLEKLLGTQVGEMEIECVE